MKTQTIRLLDVFVLGPFMVWYAMQSRDMPNAARWALGIAGVLTITYNANNYRREASRG
jgi:hypothetical protein